MAAPYVRYEKLHPRELHARLSKRKITHEMREEIIERIENKRKVTRAFKACQKQAAAYWGELLRPLRAELRNVRILIGRPVPDLPERDEALRMYEAVLVHLLDVRLLMHSTKREYTPAQLAKEANRGRIKPIVQNKGGHWTDWVPAKVQARVKAAFDAIPIPVERSNVHYTKPFSRRVPPSLLRRQKERLLERTYKERDLVMRLLMVTPAHIENRKTLAMIERAIVMIKATTEALPNTWHGMFDPKKEAAKIADAIAALPATWQGMLNHEIEQRNLGLTGVKKW